MKPAAIFCAFLMTACSDSEYSLPTVEPIPGEISGDEAWREQRTSALQVATTCKLYHDDFGNFPDSLSESLKVLDDYPTEKKLIERKFKFLDPATGETHEWIYFSTAVVGSSELLIASPESDDGFRVVCSVMGRAAIVPEVDYQRIEIPDG